MKTIRLLAITPLLIFYSCGNDLNKSDASGVFESTEIIVSAEVGGKILELNIQEGQPVNRDTKIGLIDSTQLHLSKMHLISSREALQASKPDVHSQIRATESEITKYENDKKRIEKLLAGDVATQKQLDDVNAQLEILSARLESQKSSLNISVTSIDAQSNSIDVQIEQLNDQLERCVIKSPIDGIVLVKYAEQGELTAPGKAIFKVADMKNMTLRAYVTSDQLAKITVGQSVDVLAEFGSSDVKEYQGKIAWISSKAEFTPKTIQTQDERANLVYSVKIEVENDGYLKIGMYGGFKIID